jgi:hypothetical protein
VKLDFSEDYNARLDEVIETLESVAKEYDTETLNEMVEDVTDQFVTQTGRRPNVAQLERLTDVILAKDLYDSRIHKMSQDEYPLMSDRQLHRRLAREWAQNDWNMDVGSPVVGFRSTHYTDDNGTPRKSRQPVYGRSEV